MEDREFSVIEDAGVYSSPCGYCHSSAPTSVSHGMVAGHMTVYDYQELIDQGWRRSGSFLYKPLMERCCCKHYTIRLHAPSFVPSKAQRQLLRKWERHLTGPAPELDHDRSTASPELQLSKAATQEAALPVAAGPSHVAAVPSHAGPMLPPRKQQQAARQAATPPPSATPGALEAMAEAMEATAVLGQQPEAVAVADLPLETTDAGVAAAPQLADTASELSDQHCDIRQPIDGVAAEAAADSGEIHQHGGSGPHTALRAAEQPMHVDDAGPVRCTHAATAPMHAVYAQASTAKSSASAISSPAPCLPPGGALLPKASDQQEQQVQLQQLQLLVQRLLAEALACCIQDGIMPQAEYPPAQVHAPNAKQQKVFHSINATSTTSSHEFLLTSPAPLAWAASAQRALFGVRPKSAAAAVSEQRDGFVGGAAATASETAAAFTAATAATASPASTPCAVQLAERLAAVLNSHISIGHDTVHGESGGTSAAAASAAVLVPTAGTHTHATAATTTHVCELSVHAHAGHVNFMRLKQKEEQHQAPAHLSMQPAMHLPMHPPSAPPHCTAAVMRSGHAPVPCLSPMAGAAAICMSATHPSPGSEDQEPPRHRRRLSQPPSSSSQSSPPRQASPKICGAASGSVAAAPECIASAAPSSSNANGRSKGGNNEGTHLHASACSTTPAGDRPSMDHPTVAAVSLPFELSISLTGGLPSDGHLKAAAASAHAAAVVPPSHQTGDGVLALQGPRFQVRLACSSFVQEEYELYKRYQMTQHGDPASKCSASTYRRFLVESPLAHVTREQDPSAPECGYGSFHQQYWLDGHLIAVGVVDILPRCLSSVYLFWDASAAQLSPGRFSALAELEWVHRTSLSSPQLCYYYMGYYIHTCPKMRYKADYHPSELLCPVRKVWVPLTSEIKFALDAQPYRVLSSLPGVTTAPNLSLPGGCTVLPPPPQPATGKSDDAGIPPKPLGVHEGAAIAAALPPPPAAGKSDDVGTSSAQAADDDDVAAGEDHAAAGAGDAAAGAAVQPLPPLSLDVQTMQQQQQQQQVLPGEAVMQTRSATAQTQQQQEQQQQQLPYNTNAQQLASTLQPPPHPATASHSMTAVPLQPLTDGKNSSAAAAMLAGPTSSSAPLPVDLPATQLGAAAATATGAIAENNSALEKPQASSHPADIGPAAATEEVTAEADAEHARRGEGEHYKDKFAVHDGAASGAQRRSRSGANGSFEDGNNSDNEAETSSCSSSSSGSSSSGSEGGDKAEKADSASMDRDATAVEASGTSSVAVAEVLELSTAADEVLLLLQEAPLTWKEVKEMGLIRPHLVGMVQQQLLDWLAVVGPTSKTMLYEL